MNFFYADSQLDDELIEAAEDGDIMNVKEFIKKGADVNAKDNDYGWTALMHASIYGHKEIVEILISNKADVNAKDNDDFTALMYASREGHKEIVEILKKAGAK